MRRSLARFSALESSVHAPFWADFITATPELKFSVHTRMQERDGSITNLTKTTAGTRDVPMGSLLRGLLLEWKVACPRRDGELHRVFPGLGSPQPWPLPRVGGGGPLLYWNFRRRFWAATLKKLGLSQAEVAKKLRRYQSIVANIESGERRIDVVEFLDLADAIGFDPAQLIHKLRISAKT
jgi:Helix-turn-helix